MNKLYILFFMIFCHIIDDYRLQGILASMKQKKYWKENAPQEMYKHDYIIALFMHSFSWAISIHIPIIIASSFASWILISIICNTIIHAVVDDLKANMYKINLVQDQCIHILQIIFVFLIYLVI